MQEFQKKLRQVLYNKKNTKNQVLAFIKSSINAGEYEVAINSNPILKRIKLSGGIYEKVDDIQIRDPYEFTNDFKRELFWVVYNINQEFDLINRFLYAKDKFERLFFLSKLEEAQEHLHTVKREFGENLWTIEMSLLLKENQFGTKENWSELSYYLKRLKSPFYQFIVNFYSKRIEENMSLENCFAQFQNDIDGVISDAQVKDFLVFKSLFIANFDYAYSDFEGVLYISNLFGAIDQYLIAIEVLTKLVSINSNNDKLVLQIAKKLNSKINNEHRLVNIINLLDDKSEVIKLRDSQSVLFIIDEYSKGNFDDCISLCIDCISSNPVLFEPYEIYCKSLININSDFIPTNISLVVDKILHSIYKALLYNYESEKERNRMLKYSLTLQSFNFGKQLSAFGAVLSGDLFSNQHLITGSISSLINNPRLLSLNLYNREDYVIKKNSIYKELASFNTNIFVSGNSQAFALTQSKNKLQMDVYLARRLYCQSEFIRVINVLECYVDQKVSPFYYDNILFLLFESYLNTNQLDKALQLSATILTDNRFYTNKFNVFELTKRIKGEGYDRFAQFIELPIIFSTIIKDYDLYEVYIEFMIFCDEEYPSKLLIEDLVTRFSLEKVIYFLKEVCTVSTMQYSLEFSSIDKAEQERFEICNKLKDLDKANSSVYDKEIRDILKSGAVRKAIKEVNEGRLYVNVESLKSHHLNNISESFARYKEIELTTKDKSLVGFNATKDRNLKSIDFIQKEANPHFSHPAFLAFKSIYLETRDKFLFSKEYGLDSCLSANFRHGAIKNHIRSVFEKLNLITAKLEDKYVNNLYWEEKLGLDKDLNFNVQERLRRFSKEIDDFTMFIVNNLVQIQTERQPEKKDGLFKYYTDDNLLWNFFEESKDRFTSVDSIIDILYAGLINVTLREICLNIYKTFTRSINKTYQELIEGLQSDLRVIGINNQCELLPNILKSSTNIQKELEVIADWFILNTTSSSSLLDIETIINASKEYINRINPNNCINPSIYIEFPLPANSSLIFVFNILFNNIIEHSKLNADEINVKVDVFSPKDNYIEVRVTNTISDIVNIAETNRKLQGIKDNWNNHENIERSNVEGGSGFDKIKRILIYDAIAKTDKFEYFVTNQEVSVSLFLPYVSTLANIENIILASIEYNNHLNNRHDSMLNVEIQGDVTFVAYTNLIFAFNILFDELVEFSGLPVEELKIIIEILVPESDYLELKFKSNLSKEIVNEDVFTKLKQVKDNWNNLDIEISSSGDGKGFDKIKSILVNEAFAKTDKFDFFIDKDKFQLSLFLPLNAYLNE